jgi:hypothetical protein
MERDDLALDGLLRELGRAAEGDDEAFVARVMARTRRRSSHLPVLSTAAAALLVAFGVLIAEPPGARMGLVRSSVPDAVTVRVLMKDPATGRIVALGEMTPDAQARVPVGASLRLQALGRDGMALWTAPEWLQLRPGEAKAPASGPVVSLERKSARSVEFARDVKPILEQHCAGCHAEAELVRGAAVRPFEARRSALVTQTHAPIPDAARQELALWVDLGAADRP